MNASLVNVAKSCGKMSLRIGMVALLIASLLPIFPMQAQALESEDLLQLFSQHLEYYLPFDGNSVSVTQKATTENGVSYEQGKYGQAARFDTLSDYVKLDERTQYPADYSFSIALWIKENGASDPTFFSNKDWDSGGNPGFAFVSSPSKFNAGVTGIGRVDVDNDRQLRGDSWHHFVGVVYRQNNKPESFSHVTATGYFPL